MQHNKDNPNELLNLLLDKCDHLYQQNSLLKGKLEDRTDVDALKHSYEQTISVQEEKILSLESQVAYLKRRLWGKSSERFVNPDPRQRVIDFEGMDLLPQEKELAEEAQKEIESLKVRRKKERVKRKPVRKALSEDLPRIEEHLYPEEIKQKQDDWTELEPEITEILEFEPGKCYVHRIIRHKYVRKNKQEDISAPIVIAKLPLSYQPIVRSYERSITFNGTDDCKICLSSSFLSPDTNAQTTRCGSSSLYSK